MAGIDPALVLALQHRMAGDQSTLLEDPHLGRMVLDLDEAAPGRVRHAVLVAPDRDHSFLADPPLHRQHCVVGVQRQGQQMRPPLGKMVIHDPLCGGMHAGIGDGHAPVLELDVQIIHVAEAAAEEEVLAHVAEGPLDLALRLRPIGLAGPRRGPVMRQQRHERLVVGHHARRIFADDRRLHPVIEDLDAGPAHRSEGRDVAAHHRFQRLVRAEPPPQPAAVAQHHAEQPDFAKDAGLRGELDLELGKVHLRLLARSGLEAPLELSRNRGPDQAKIFRQRRIGPLVTHRLDLAMQPARREPGERRQPFGQIRPELVGQSFTRFPRPIDRGLQTPLEIFPHRLAIQPRLPRNRADAQALTLQFQDHHDLPQSHHLRALPLASAGGILRRRWSGGHAPLTIGISAKLGNFHPAVLGSLRPALTRGGAPIENEYTVSASSRLDGLAELVGLLGFELTRGGRLLAENRWAKGQSDVEVSLEIFSASLARAARLKLTATLDLDMDAVVHLIEAIREMFRPFVRESMLDEQNLTSAMTMMRGFVVGAIALPEVEHYLADPLRGLAPLAICPENIFLLVNVDDE
jgi:hypothetical protein